MTTPREQIIAEWEATAEYDKVNSPTMEEFLNVHKMKQTYKLINLDTKVETICEKVVDENKIEHYISTESVKGGEFESLPFKSTPRGDVRADCIVYDAKTNNIYEHDFLRSYCILNRHFLVIASESQIVDEDLHKYIMEEMGYPSYMKKESLSPIVLGSYELSEKCYNKRAETHKWTDEDMVEFLEWIEKEHWWKSTDTRFELTLGLWTKTINGDFKKEDGFTTQELLQLFKDQQPKVLYYK